MVVVQRVLIEWSSGARGAAAFARRRTVPTVLPLPDVPDTELVVHDIHAIESADYRLTARILTGDDAAAAVSLRLRRGDAATVIVERQPLWVAYPRGPLRRGRRLFTLDPGQVGRYQVNLRDTGCQCVPACYYQHWVIHVANAPAAQDLFLATAPTHDIDERTHLYGDATTVRRHQ